MVIFNPYIWQYNKNKRWFEMIVFDPLWDTLKRKKITTYYLIKNHKLSRGTLDNLKHNCSVTLNTINELCSILDCEIQDIIKYVQDNKE
jgi:DNA-binding Xre family transcriptional regulator